jgi:hypothetical protein
LRYNSKTISFAGSGAEETGGIAPEQDEDADFFSEVERGDAEERAINRLIFEK